MGAGIIIDADDASDFLATFKKTTDSFFDDIDDIKAAFNDLCNAWRDQSRNDFEEELNQFSQELRRVVENTEEDKLYLRRLIEMANEIAQVRIRRS